MFEKIKNWFRPKASPSLTELSRLSDLEVKLASRCTAEIAARLLRRAELHDKENTYLRACSVLDRVAAENIRTLEGQNGKCMGDWLARRDMCLRLLREVKK